MQLDPKVLDEASEAVAHLARCLKVARKAQASTDDALARATVGLDALATEIDQLKQSRIGAEEELVDELIEIAPGRLATDREVAAR